MVAMFLSCADLQRGHAAVNRTWRWEDL